MPHTKMPIAEPSQLRGNLSVSIGLTAVFLFFVFSGYITYWNTRNLSENAQEVTRTHDVITSIERLFSLMKDAETGQRGYVITGDDRYLEPYNVALSLINDEFKRLSELCKNSREQSARLPEIKSFIGLKLQELKESIQVRRTKGFAATLAIIETDRGKATMDGLRDQVNTMKQAERERRASRFADMDNAYRIAVAGGIVTALLGLCLSVVVAFLVRRSTLTRQRQEWLQSGQVGLSSSMLGEQSAMELGVSVITFLAQYFNAPAGAFFIKEGGSFQRVATYGISTGDETLQHFEMGDGLIGQAAKDNRIMSFNEVPDGYLTISSALGYGKPRYLLIAPAAVDGDVNAMIELGFMNPLDEKTIELMRKVSDAIGVAVRSANYRASLQNLLEETQRQSEELQSQSEELRVSNEELEEQSRALKESQVRLEQQQAELEQTNSQLEEQTQQLENQRDILARSRTEVQLKAKELERASQYKSDFLANMSHELRTPLNSSLILAKLLADNPQGNLTEEQVKFAQTIQSSGNDLLALINDILDLSKIEAGHMEVRPEPVLIEQLAKDMTHSFKQVAAQKKLKFDVQVAPNCPMTVETDRQRLEQVLRNLISNALKFTEKGKVELSIARYHVNQVALTVSDTGIGIAKEQQQLIFEAFRQADGTISRKYGGTGLGLSISRELARLLGGSIELKSKPGKGSSFTVIIPETYDPSLVPDHVRVVAISQSEQEIEPIAETAVKPKKGKQKKGESALPAPSIEDDRDHLKGDRHTILVVEDDESFARILYDMAHELNFQCLMASTAEDALAVADHYRPDAVVLDVGLPDNSGLSVLDRLKRNVRTRHIPVHVVSGSDYTQTALSLGAVGYMLKPVKRDELLKALQQLETKLSQRMRRVLIVEDDAVQRDSMQKLLGSHEVETVAVGTAGECLKRLKQSTFDCMVLDLSLPDASGYSLLETLSKEDAYSFPPVIVYTGRDLSANEEQSLRRYSKSIIIKGAKSPERLLDEVTLFLHQVVATLPAEQQKMLEKARNRDAVLEGRNILVVEDDVRNVYALTNILEPRGAVVHIARNGREALDVLEARMDKPDERIDLVLMDVMMPEMDGLTATREIRKRSGWKKLPVIMLTAKAMKDDQERCLDAGANDYMAKPLDVDKLLSLVRVWMPR